MAGTDGEVISAAAPAARFGRAATPASNSPVMFTAVVTAGMIAGGAARTLTINTTGTSTVTGPVSRWR